MFLPILLLALTILASASPARALALAELDARVVGGASVRNMAGFPFITSMHEWSGIMANHYKYAGCGGAVVSPTEILTAAHCVWSKDENRQRDLTKPHERIWFRAGTVWRDHDGEFRKVEKIEVHPKYEGRAVNDYDVAIVTLDKPLPLSNDIQKSTLVESGAKLEEGHILEVAGWGVSRKGKTGFEYSPLDLQHALLQVVDHDVCKKKYKGVEGVQDITEAMFCSAGKGQDSCKGDSGGPVVDHKSRVLVGVVSWAKDCANPRYPGVNTDLANPDINKWIRDQLKK